MLRGTGTNLDSASSCQRRDGMTINADHGCTSMIRPAARGHTMVSDGGGSVTRWLGEDFRSPEDDDTAVGESVLRQRPDLADLQRQRLKKPRAFGERLTAEHAAHTSPRWRRVFERISRRAG